MPRKLVLGITGASGVAYGVRLLEVLRATDCEVHLSISGSGRTVLRHELDIDMDLLRPDVDRMVLPTCLASQESKPSTPSPQPPVPSPQSQAPNPQPPTPNLHYHYFEDFLAPIASGSFLTDGMVICPCSGGTLAAIAHGTSENLIARAADVHLKERRKLVLVPRETPLSLIHLDNMRRCAEAGAVILPASPGFYHGMFQRGEARVLDLIDFVVARVCDQLGVPHELMRRWGE